MWLPTEEEILLDEIHKTQHLTAGELAAIENYKKFKEIRKLNPNHEGLGLNGINPLKDILEKYKQHIDNRHQNSG